MSQQHKHGTSYRNGEGKSLTSEQPGCQAQEDLTGVCALLLKAPTVSQSDSFSYLQQDTAGGGEGRDPEPGSEDAL